MLEVLVLTFTLTITQFPPCTTSKESLKKMCWSVYLQYLLVGVYSLIATKKIQPANFVFFVPIGFLFCFFGSSMWRFTVFVAGFYAFGAFSATVTLNILQNDEYHYRSEEECVTILLIVFAIAGLIGGLLATWYVSASCFRSFFLGTTRGN